MLASICLVFVSRCALSLC